MAKTKEIILGVTGSIAAYKACEIIRRLQDSGCSVTVVMTRGAEHFITPLTLASLSGRSVYRDMFDEKEGSWQRFDSSRRMSGLAHRPERATNEMRSESYGMNHILMGQKADTLLIAPATANIIGKIANGIADDLLSCIAITTKAKILIAPAMNEDMYKNKIVQGNIAKLKSLGVHFIDPVHGKLACGTFGEGHLADVEDIVKATRSFKK